MEKKKLVLSDIIILLVLIMVPVIFIFITYKEFMSNKEPNKNNNPNFIEKIFKEETTEEIQNEPTGVNQNEITNNNITNNQIPSNNSNNGNNNSIKPSNSPSTNPSPKPSSSPSSKPSNSPSPKPSSTPVNNKIAVSSIKLNTTAKTINTGATFKLTATISPSNATNKTITWTSSNPKIATVTNGEVKGLTKGKTVITAKTSNGKTATCTVTVNSTNTTVAVSSVSLSETHRTVYLNSSNTAFSLTATVSPSNATNKTITWSSSNNGVATVSNGLVTPISPGQVTITATAGGVSNSMTLVVKKKVIIELGASQSYRFIKYNANSYVKGNNHYSYNANNVNNSTLVHIAKNGALMTWQYDMSKEGYQKTKAVIESYSSTKQFIEFYLYYLLIGNTIRDYSCNSINNTPSIYNNPLTGYSNATNSFRNLGYNVTTYVVSMHPLKPGESGAEAHVVSNTNSNYCEKQYRSNWKYNQYNIRVQNSIMTSFSNLIYVDTFNKIMDTSSATATNRKYNYKLTYNCEGDGVHWDSNTTHMYLKLMLDSSNANL